MRNFSLLNETFPVEQHSGNCCVRVEGTVDSGKESLFQTIHIKEQLSSTIAPRTLIARQLHIMARKITRLRTSCQDRTVVSRTAQTLAGKPFTVRLAPRT